MKIELGSPQGRRDVNDVRSQIKDVTSLKGFDEFVSKNNVFDFNNDEHLQALKKTDCHCTVTTTVPISIKP